MLTKTRSFLGFGHHSEFSNQHTGNIYLAEATTDEYVIMCSSRRNKVSVNGFYQDSSEFWTI